VIWSYVGDIDGIAAIGAHTLSSKKEYMTVDQWIEFLTSPAVCMSSRDWGKQKTTLEQACYYARCNEEELNLLKSVVNRVDKHFKRVKTVSYQRSLDLREFDPMTLQLD